jgi:hypothetical protein
MHVTTHFDAEDLATLDTIAGTLGLDRSEVILRAVRLAGMVRAVCYVNGVVRPVADPRGGPAPL